MNDDDSEFRLVRGEICYLVLFSSRNSRIPLIKTLRYLGSDLDGLSSPAHLFEEVDFNPDRIIDPIRVSLDEATATAAVYSVEDLLFRLKGDLA